MVLNLGCYILICMYIIKFAHYTYIIISSQVTVVKITVHIGFVNLCTAVTSDDVFQFGDGSSNDHPGLKITIGHRKLTGW